jgi:hypothetical protein
MVRRRASQRVRRDVDDVAIVVDPVGGRQQEAPLYVGAGRQVHLQPRAAGRLIDQPALDQPLAGPLQFVERARSIQHQDGAAIRAIGNQLAGGRLVEVEDNAGLLGVAPETDLHQTDGGGARVAGGEGGEAESDGGCGDKRPPPALHHGLPNPSQHHALSQSPSLRGGFAF